MRASSILLVAVLTALPALPVRPAAAQSVTTSFTLSSAVRVRFDHTGNLFVSQRVGSRVYKVAKGTTTPVVFATGFTDPLGLGIDSHDNLYVANYQSADLHQVSPAGVRTVFATGFAHGACVAVDAQDNVYVGEMITQDVYRVTPAGAVTLYGNANLAPYPSGVSPESRLTGLAFDPSGNLWCGSYGAANQVGPFPLSVIPAGGGTGVQKPKVSQAILDFAYSPANGFFYTAGYQSNQLGVLTLDGTLTDYAGTGTAGLLNGAIATARFNWPSGIALDACGNLFVADWNNSAVREVTLAAGDPLCSATPAATGTWGRLKTTYR